MKSFSLLLATCLLTAAGTTSSLADDATFDVAFGVGVANNYISRGSTQSADKPIIDGYMEATYGIFYAGAFVRNSASFRWISAMPATSTTVRAMSAANSTPRDRSR